MSGKVEQVAKALFIAEIGPEIGPFEWSIDLAGEVAARKYRTMARAAIEAMREPTAEMVKQGDDYLDGTQHFTDHARDVWTVMLSAALR